MFDRTSILPVIFSLATSMLLSFALTPLVKRLAYKIGAVDIPKDKRRMHDHPIPRLGGLAIFIGFVITVLIFSQADRQLRGILLGACLIVAVGVVDDSHPLGAGIKFILQIVAALIAVWHGVVIQAIASPFPFGEPYWDFGIMAVPITVIWIVAVTNSVNLIDGLDGLADGVSTIAALTMLIIALLLRDLKMAVICAALVGACVGFIPYNRNPAKIFMGDTGATFLGYMLATVSVTGLFKHPEGAEPHEGGPQPHPSQAHRHGYEPEAGGSDAVPNRHRPGAVRGDDCHQGIHQGNPVHCRAGRRGFHGGPHCPLPPRPPEGGQPPEGTGRRGTLIWRHCVL